jgi:hypothetical protein
VSRWAIAKDARFGAAFRIVEINGLRLRRDFVLASRKAPELSGPAAEFRNYVLETTRKRSTISRGG